MLEETTDNLNQGASEETTSDAIQTGGTETESLEGLKARLASLESELAAKTKQIENANKLIGRKAVDVETLRRLGLTKDEQTQVAAQVQGMTKQEGREMAQSLGGNEMEAWFKQAEQKIGTAGAIQAMISAAMPQFLAQHLAPVNEQLNTARDRVNQAALKAATARLGEEFDDVGEKADAIKQYLKDNPKKRDMLVDPSTDEDEKYDLLETVYLKVSKVKNANTAAASKAAGAVESQQRERMKEATVTNGSRSNKGDAPKLEDLWEQSMKEHDKGRNLFGD